MTQFVEADMRVADIIKSGRWREHYQNLRERLWPTPPRRAPVRRSPRKRPLVEIIAVTAEPITEEVPAPNHWTIRRIQERVAKQFGIAVSDLTSQVRTRPIVFYRQIAITICRRSTPNSFPLIGKFFGGRDHTTVLHAWKKINPQLTAMGLSPDAGVDETLCFCIDHYAKLFPPLSNYDRKKHDRQA